MSTRKTLLLIGAGGLLAAVLSVSPDANAGLICGPGSYLSPIYGKCVPDAYGRDFFGQGSHGYGHGRHGVAR